MASDRSYHEISPAEIPPHPDAHQSLTRTLIDLGSEGQNASPSRLSAGHGPTLPPRVPADLPHTPAVTLAGSTPPRSLPMQPPPAPTDNRSLGILNQKEPAVLEMRTRIQASKIGRRKYVRETMNEVLMPADKAAENYEGQEDLSSEFGNRFYKHGFRRRGEKVQDAIRRWFKYYENDESVMKGIMRDKCETLGKSFIQTMNENISRNLYSAFLHDLYAQRLREYVNMIVLPIILLNSVSAAVAALSLMDLGPEAYLSMSIATTVFNLFAAILVAIQKFFQYEEKAALHEAIKDEYFKVISEQSFLVLDINIEPETGMVCTALGAPLSGKDIKERLKRLSDLQRKMEGVPDEPVPENIANNLQPYVITLQKKDGFVGRGLAGFPSVLGIKSYFLEVPEMTGCTTIYCDGKVCCQLGFGCNPIPHPPTEEGCEMTCCGSPFWHKGFKPEAKARVSKLTMANLKLAEQLEKEAKLKAMHNERKKNRRTLQLMRQVQAVQQMFPSADVETGEGTSEWISGQRPVAESNEGRPMLPGFGSDSSDDESEEEAAEAKEELKAWMAVKRKVVRCPGPGEQKGLVERVSKWMEGQRVSPAEDKTNPGRSGQPLGEATDTILGSACQAGDTGSDFDSEYGEEYYPPGFKLQGEKTYEAVWRWWEMCNNDDAEAFKARDNISSMAYKGKAFMQTMTEAMSRNLYRALLNDAYSQILKRRANLIAVPLILMNALNSAFSATTIMKLPDIVKLTLTLGTVLLNVISAVLVSVQKFFKYAERAAIHEALKKGYFDAYNAETDLVIDMTMDPGTKCFITTSEEGDIKALDFSDMAKKLEKLKRIEQKASGLPEESVPQDMARKLNPYIRQVQRDGYEDRMHLFSFPPVLGVKSYFLDVPDMTGICSIVSDGAVTCEVGHGCHPLNHQFNDRGCEILCCGKPCIVCNEAKEEEEEQMLVDEESNFGGRKKKSKKKDKKKSNVEYDLPEIPEEQEELVDDELAAPVVPPKVESDMTRWPPSMTMLASQSQIRSGALIKSNQVAPEGQ